MILPVQVTFRNMETSPEVEAWIQEEAEKLDTYYGRTTSCRVIVETPHSHSPSLGQSLPRQDRSRRAG